MSFPKDPVRSPGWYDNCFEGAEPAMPADVRQFSEAVCDRFSISGICDPMYIANVTAFELGRGDGRGVFFDTCSDAREDAQARLSRLAERLSFAYSSSTHGQRDVVLQLARETLVV